ncbi:MAG TPA: class I SAM-dependent methyltransferase [Polyangiaceae bacterium]|nr:class I SAM-dependent methyltransferase [Polyangiaceae bacterium]
MPLVAPAAGWLSEIATARARLERDLERGLPLGADVAPRLGALLDRVVDWGRHLDLTAARTPQELVDQYLADALVIAALEPPDDPSPWIDVGSGGGAPALTLALLRPDASLTLVEPRTRRAAFLRAAAAAVEARQVTVARQRSEVLPAGAWRVALSRATLPPDRWLAEGARLASGAVWVLLGRGARPTHARARPTHDVRYRLPFTGAERRAVRYEVIDR